MLLSEKQARLKWCPFTRFNGDPSHGGGDNKPRETPGTNCIASDCMAWRQVDLTNPDYEGQGRLIVGYCGLAGRPE